MNQIHPNSFLCTEGLITLTVKEEMKRYMIMYSAFIAGESSFEAKKESKSEKTAH